MKPNALKNWYETETGKWVYAILNDETHLGLLCQYSTQRTTKYLLHEGAGKKFEVTECQGSVLEIDGAFIEPIYASLRYGCPKPGHLIIENDDISIVADAPPNSGKFRIFNIKTGMLDAIDDDCVCHHFTEWKLEIPKKEVETLMSISR